MSKLTANQKIKIINNANDGDFKLNVSSKCEKTVIAEVELSKSKNAYVYGVEDGGDTEVETKLNSFIPYLPIFALSNGDVMRLLIYGDAGKGKTTQASIIAEQYHKHYPKNRILYVSTQDIDDDANLKDQRYIMQLDTTDLPPPIVKNPAKWKHKIQEQRKEYLQSEGLPDDDKFYLLFSNSLIIIDDVDYHSENDKVYFFLNNLTQNGRKHNISLIFITHRSCQRGVSMYDEFNMLITYEQNLHKLIKNAKLDLTTEKIHQIKSYKPTFICFNQIFKCIILRNYVIKN